MYRYILMPELEGDSTTEKIWRRIYYSFVLTSLESFLAVVAIMAGLPVILDPFNLSLVSGSLVALLPNWLLILWGFQMVAGGVTTLTGVAKRDYRIEQIGVMFLLSGAFIYLLALGFALPTSWPAFVTYFFATLALCARYWVLGKLIKLTRRLTKKVLADAAKEQD